MRDAFTKATGDTRARITEGTFDKTGIESGWADVVIIAQVRDICKPTYRTRLIGRG